MATAWLLRDVFPAVHSALSEGRIDLSKAKMLLREVEAADPDHARAVLDQVLATAAHRSYAALRDTVRRLLLAIDPALVRRRYQLSIQRRSVTHTEHGDGTASIIGRGLPKETVAAVFDHLNRLTGAIKRASRQVGAPIPADTRTADQVRADLFLDLLQGVDPVTAGIASPGPGKGAVQLTVEARDPAGAQRTPR